MQQNRRHAILLISTSLGLVRAGDARADNGALPLTCTPATAGPLVPYTDAAAGFRLRYPCGWRQVTSLMPGGSVLASFFNPEEPGAETLAVYRGAAPEGVRTTSELGSPQEVAARLAAQAPNGLVVEAHGLARGGRQYAVVHVQFGGNTAGMFGAAREFRCVVVDQGVQTTLRVTTTRYRYLALPPLRDVMGGAADSLELLA